MRKEVWDQTNKQPIKQIETNKQTNTPTNKQTTNKQEKLTIKQENKQKQSTSF